MKKVLVVDDTKNIRLLLTKCLEYEGCSVDTAADGVEALAKFQSVQYELAFLDIKMPRLSGTEVLKSIREMGIRTPVIIITAYGTVKNAVECTKLGAVTYLQKPFTAEKVRAVLSELVNESEAGGTDQQAELLLEEARALMDTGSYAGALAVLKCAAARQIDNPEVYRLISKAYCGMGDQENADRFLKASRVFAR